MRKFGLADGLGIMAALVAVAYVPGLVDPLTYPKLLVLAAGGLALAPAVYLRWRSRPRPSVPVLVVIGAALAILAWGLISTFASGAPWAVSLFGWWGRGDGWLAWAGAAVLLLGAATLDRSEVTRTITWLMGGATVVALVGILQVTGVSIAGGGSGQVSALMGNTNFASGYAAIIGVLALGQALAPGALWLRAWGAVLFVVLGVLSVLTDALQGPAALAAGVVALGVGYALLYRGRWRVAGLAASAVVVAAGVGLLVASFFAVGPLARLWSEQTFDIRQEYWQSAWNIMNGLPVFGTGPDGFARYVGEYRPESYVELLGPVLRVSAAHNVALQFGAVLGWLGLLLWIVVFIGTVLLLLVRLVRGGVASLAVTASVFGALVAYLVQGMVSIDMIPILATGWIVAGLAIAAAREPIPQVAPPAEATSSPKRPNSRTPVRVGDPSTPAWVPISGGVVGLIIAVLVAMQISVAGQANSLTSQDQAVGFMTSGLSPCPLRVNVTQQVLQQVPAEVSVPSTYSATDLDPRCAPMITFQSEVALQTEDLERAGTSTADGIAFDPLLDAAWLLRARYLLQTGDTDGAQAALEEAARVQALYPETAERASLVEIQEAIDATGG